MSTILNSIINQVVVVMEKMLSSTTITIVPDAPPTNNATDVDEHAHVLCMYTLVFTLFSFYLTL